MSDSTECEVCQLVGFRRRGKLVPDGWFYAEANINDEDGTVTDLLVIGVCSETCKASFFKRGPGKLIPGLKKSTD